MRGFTLVEALVTLLILCFLVAGIFFVLNLSNINWNIGMGLLDLQQQARLSMDSMTREIRQTKPTGITVNGPGTRVDFYVPGSNNAISYYLSNNQIIREHPAGTTQILANGITALNFCCLGGANCQDCANSNLLQINIQSGKTIMNRPLSFPLTEKVRFRNG